MTRMSESELRAYQRKHPHLFPEPPAPAPAPAPAAGLPASASNGYTSEKAFQADVVRELTARGADAAVGARSGDRTTPKSSLSGRNIGLLITAVVLVVAIAALNLIHVPKVIMRPGPVTNTLGKVGDKPVIEVKGAKTYPTSGKLDFTTVSMAGGPQYPVSGMEWLRTKYFDKDAEIYPEEMWFPKGVTSKQVQQQSTAEMTAEM